MNSVMAEGGKIRGCNGSSKWWAESLPPVVIELTDLPKIAPSFRHHWNLFILLDAYYLSVQGFRGRSRHRHSHGKLDFR